MIVSTGHCKEASLSRELNSAAAYSHLCYLWAPYPSTILTGVKKLEPSTYMIVVNGKITKKETFYDLPFNNPIEAMSVDEATQRVHDGLRTAVNRQMVADVPVGAFLSGGLDSSAVVAFARKHDMAQAMQCFTIGFRGGVSKLADLLDDVTSPESLNKHGIFDPKAVAALVKANRLQQVDASNNLFSILCMELWCRLFLDTDPKDFKTPEDLPLATQATT